MLVCFVLNWCSVWLLMLFRIVYIIPYCFYVLCFYTFYCFWLLYLPLRKWKQRANNLKNTYVLLCVRVNCTTLHGFAWRSNVVVVSLWHRCATFVYVFIWSTWLYRECILCVCVRVGLRRRAVTGTSWMSFACFCMYTFVYVFVWGAGLWQAPRGCKLGVYVCVLCCVCLMCVCVCAVCVRVCVRVFV